MPPHVTSHPQPFMGLFSSSLDISSMDSIAYTEAQGGIADENYGQGTIPVPRNTFVVEDSARRITADVDVPMTAFADSVITQKSRLSSDEQASMGSVTDTGFCPQRQFGEFNSFSDYMSWPSPDRETDSFTHSPDIYNDTAYDYFFSSLASATTSVQAVTEPAGLVLPVAIDSSTSSGFSNTTTPSLNHAIPLTTTASGLSNKEFSTAKQAQDDSSYAESPLFLPASHLAPAQDGNARFCTQPAQAARPFKKVRQTSQFMSVTKEGIQDWRSTLSNPSRSSAIEPPKSSPSTSQPKNQNPSSPSRASATPPNVHSSRHSIRLRTTSCKPKHGKRDDSNEAADDNSVIPELQRAREIHNHVEKQYRKRLNVEFEHLLAAVPTEQLHNDDDAAGVETAAANAKGVSKAKVLDMARRRIKMLEEEKKKLLLENADLRRTVERQRSELTSGR